MIVAADSRRPLEAVVTSPANPAVKAARRLLRRPGRGGELLVEGPQGVREAGRHLRRLFVTPAAAEREPELVAAAAASGAHVVIAADEVVRSLTDTVTPQGVVGVAVLPGGNLEVLLRTARLVLVLHEVRDPGNAGTAVRTADAAGADAVVVTGDAVDVRNAKAVRASAGSLFHLPVLPVPAFATFAALARAAGVRLVAAAGDGATSYTDVDYTRPTAIVFGNEAHGVGRDVLEQCDEVARVPLWAGGRPGYAGSAESLNLAATVAVFAFEAARQLAASGTEPSC